jgi:hypothetical protein
MGTVERGESNLSFENILKVATTLGITLSTLFTDIEGRAETLTVKSATEKAGIKGQKAAAKTPQTGRS